MPRAVTREVVFSRAFDAHHDAVARYCLRRLPQEDVDDAVARVFTVAWRKLDELPAVESALPWLYRVARFEVSTMRRSARRQTALRTRVAGLAGTAPDEAEVVAVRRSDRDAVRAALDTLSDGDREVLLLRSFEDLPVGEIAAVLECSRDAAAKRISRALERLRAALDLTQSATFAFSAGDDSSAGDR